MVCSVWVLHLCVHTALMMLTMHDIYTVNISKILAVTTLSLDDVFVKYISRRAWCKKSRVDSRPGCREMTRNVMLTCSRFCVHGDQVSQVNISKSLAVMTLRLDHAFVKYALPSPVHKTACLYSSWLQIYVGEEMGHGI